MGTQRVLLVDKSLSTLKQARVTLEFEGYRVYESLDGKAGLKAALERKPDVVVAAVTLPKVNGYDLCHAIRSGTEPVLVIQ